jgi:predicted ribonuclease YlaK
METSKTMSAKTKKLKAGLLLYEPFTWTEKQKSTIDSILDKNTKAVFINGCAGVGKTELSVFSALKSLINGDCKKILYLRSIVESSSHKLGYLKGSIEEKTDPYFEVLEEKLENFLNPSEIENLKKDKKINAIPNNFLRGRDFKDSFIICDEAQNFTFQELTTIISRISENTKIVFLYDPNQSDISFKNKNDILNFNEIFNDSCSRDAGIFSFYYSSDEIKRSEFCKFVMGKIERYLSIKK